RGGDAGGDVVGVEGGGEVVADRQGRSLVPLGLRLVVLVPREGGSNDRDEQQQHDQRDGATHESSPRLRPRANPPSTMTVARPGVNGGAARQGALCRAGGAGCDRDAGGGAGAGSEPGVLCPLPPIPLE